MGLRFWPYCDGECKWIWQTPTLFVMLLLHRDGCCSLALKVVHMKYGFWCWWWSMTRQDDMVKCMSKGFFVMLRLVNITNIAKIPAKNVHLVHVKWKERRSILLFYVSKEIIFDPMFWSDSKLWILIKNLLKKLWMSLQKNVCRIMKPRIYRRDMLAWKGLIKLIIF